MRSDQLSLLCFVVLCFSTAFVFADIPAHCVYDQVVGDWVFMTGPDGNDNSVSCGNDNWKISKWQQITLSEPDVAHDAYGNKGFWTLIYDQGFEVVINDIKYFAFFDYSVNGTHVTSYCSRTSPGWYHNKPSAPGAIPKNWGCYSAVRTNFMQVKEVTHTLPLGSPRSGATRFVEDHDFVAKLNAAQSSWTAGINPSWVGEELAKLQRKAGKVMPEYRRIQTTKSKRLTARTSEDEQVISSLPLNFDWRNVSGVNYDSPIRDQLECGSCYAHATVEMLEARTRILTNNTNQVLLSPQVVVSCSQYSQGCNGGFTYLVSKYGEDFGLVTEGCFPYQSGLNPNVSCSAGCNDVSQKRFVTNYTYVGGYYGGCSEAAMMLELYSNGPIAIAFEVYPDFTHYTGGIYHHVDNLVGVNGWEITNHEVVIVGWGVDAATGEKYWIVKNSWGYSFGEGGYFRIRRGTDECSIESSAYSSFPVL